MGVSIVLYQGRDVLPLVYVTAAPARQQYIPHCGIRGSWENSLHPQPGLVCPGGPGGGETPAPAPGPGHSHRHPPLPPPDERRQAPLQEHRLVLQGGAVQVRPGQHPQQRQGVVQLRQLPEGPGEEGAGEALLQGERQAVAGLRDRSQQPRNRDGQPNWYRDPPAEGSTSRLR